MKKFNQCFGVAPTKAGAEALVKQLGKGHPVKSGGMWRVMKYPPGKAPLIHESVRRVTSAPQAPNTTSAEESEALSSDTGEHFIGG